MSYLCLGDGWNTLPLHYMKIGSKWTQHSLRYQSTSDALAEAFGFGFTQNQPDRHPYSGQLPYNYSVFAFPGLGVSVLLASFKRYRERHLVLWGSWLLIFDRYAFELVCSTEEILQELVLLFRETFWSFVATYMSLILISWTVETWTLFLTWPLNFGYLFWKFLEPTHAFDMTLRGFGWRLKIGWTFQEKKHNMGWLSSFGTFDMAYLYNIFHE